jgi:broad specificity phosphatase PhoE
MTQIYLVRHGANDSLGRELTGRSSGVHLNETGRAQAVRVAEALAAVPVTHVLSSPLERCRETAQPLADRLKLPVTICDAVTEVDFGDWTRKSFQDLDGMEAWRQWNAFRSGGQIPNGESMIQVQTRMVGELERLRRQHPKGTLVIFSHGDPIRAALTWYLGMPLDLLSRLEVFPASINLLAVNDWDARIRALNLTV